MSDKPESVILQILRQMRAELATRADLAAARSEVADLRAEVAEMRSDLRSLRADVASDILIFRRQLNEQIVGLHRAVIEYRSAVGFV